jgi:hypothetical protein
MAAAVLVAWVASPRWSGTPWIVRPRRVRRTQIGCICLSCTAPAGAWPGSARASVAFRAAGPWPWLLPFLLGGRSRIRLDLNSATIANKLNSSRSTGSVGLWIEPPRLSFTLHLVSSSKMSRASGSEPCDAPQAGRLAKRCDALVPEGLRLAPDRGDTSAVHCDPVRVAGDHPGGRSCVPNLSVTVGSEPRSDAIGIRRTRLGSLHPPPRGEHPRPTNGHPDGCRWLSAGSDHLLPGRGPSAYTRHQLASDRPEREE